MPFATMKGKQHMNRDRLIARKITLGIIAAVCWSVLGGCEYEVPITAKPTRKVDERLLGNWTSKDGKDKMKVVRLNDSNYIVCYNGDLFRAYHSDVAKTPFVSVQNLDSAKPKYAYLAWKLTDDGTLHLRNVNDKVIPDETKTSASVRKLLEKNLQNPKLLEDEGEFTKDK
jgi:hypothetical protein